MRGLLAVPVLSISLVAAADEPRPSTPRMIVDTSWRPSPGDTATVHPIGAPSLPTAYSVNEYMKFAAARDTVGIRGLADRKLVEVLDPGTGVLVVHVQSHPDYDAPPNDRPIYVSAEVRVLDGPHKDELRFVAADALARLKPSRWVDPYPPREKPRPVEPAVRAATLLQSARNLEKAGNLKAARETYRRVVKEFPGTSSTAPAAERLKATGGP